MIARERLLYVLALTAVLLAAGCSKSHGRPGISGSDGGSDSDDPVPVEVVTLRTGHIESVLRFSANLEAEVQVQVLARAPGQVRQLRVEEGDVVSKNQVLLRLEDEEQRSAVERVETDLALAQRTYDKQKQLHGDGVVSDQALETAEFELKRLQIARNDAERALRYTTVRASVAGTVSARLVKLGDFVVPNQQLFQITDFDSIVAKVFVPEKEMSQLKPQLEARVVAQTGDGEPHAGVVDRIAPVVDPRSGTVKVTIDIPTPDGLRPGMFVDVELATGEHADAVLLPRRALVYDNDVPYAFKLIEGDRVERVRVDPVIEAADYLEPATGFAAGDRVVIAGQVGLKDRAKVTATNAPGADAPAADAPEVDAPDGAR